MFYLIWTLAFFIYKASVWCAFVNKKDTMTFCIGPSLILFNLPITKSSVLLDSGLRCFFQEANPIVYSEPHIILVVERYLSEVGR